MSKCDNCLEWEYFGDGTVGCFCMRRTEKLKDDEDCVLFAEKNKNIELTEPLMPVGGYLPKTISDEELKKIIKDRADMCMAILNGEDMRGDKE